MPTSEQHPYFPSGDWKGFYNDPSGNRPRGEMSMTLEFSNGRITGGGSDSVGAYAWSGACDTKAGHLSRAGHYQCFTYGPIKEPIYYGSSKNNYGLH